MILAFNIFLQLWSVLSLLLHLAVQLTMQIWSDLKLDKFILWSKRIVLHGWKKVRRLGAECL